MQRKNEEGLPKTEPVTYICPCGQILEPEVDSPYSAIVYQPKHKRILFLMAALCERCSAHFGSPQIVYCWTALLE